MKVLFAINKSVGHFIKNINCLKMFVGLKYLSIYLETFKLCVTNLRMTLYTIHLNSITFLGTWEVVYSLKLKV